MVIFPAFFAGFRRLRHILRSPVVPKPFHCPLERPRRISIHRNLEIPPFVLRIGRKETHAHGTGKPCPGCRLRQTMHPQRPPKPYLLSQYLAGQPVKAGDLATAAGQHNLLAWQVIEPGRIKPCAHLFENFLECRSIRPGLRGGDHARNRRYHHRYRSSRGRPFQWRPLRHKRS